VIRKGLGIVLLLLAGPVLAEGISYNFVQLGYQRVELDDINLDGDGFEIGGSVELNEYLFVLVDYSQAGFDFDIDLDQLQVGVGYHVGMSPTTDLIAVLSYVQAEASLGGLGSEDQDGFGVTLGARGAVTEKFELQGDVSYVDLGNGVDGTTFEIGGIYSFTEALAGTLKFDFEEDATVYAVGLRYYFGT
jgi:hypothetical protein